MKKLLAAVLVLCCVLTSASLAFAGTVDTPIEIKVLILPKFEVGEMAGDFPGEAQYYYEAYCAGGEAYDVACGAEGSRLYVRDGVALYVTGMGKVNAALSTLAVLQDSRFDFSNAYVLNTGCAGSAVGWTVMGDVFVVSACVDFDLGHHADSREMSDPEANTWYRDTSYDSSAVKFLNADLTARVYELVKGVRIETTDVTRAFMSAAFDGAEWAVRDPMVQRGTTVSGDNYWKGARNEANAIAQTESYGCPDRYALTEMEDVAVANACERAGLLNRLIIIRDSVNMDVFMNGATPESLWDPSYEASLSDTESIEAADIFKTAMENNYKVGSVVIDAILNGSL